MIRQGGKKKKKSQKMWITLVSECRYTQSHCVGSSSAQLEVRNNSWMIKFSVSDSPASRESTVIK